MHRSIRVARALFFVCACAPAITLSAAGCGAGGALLGGPRVRDTSELLAQAQRGADVYDALGYRLAWRGVPLVEPRERIEFLDVYGDTVVTQSTGSTITLMEEANGRNRWSVRLADRLTKFVGTARVGDRILSASDNELFVLDARTGDLLDRQRLALIVNTKPTVQQGVAVFGSVTGEALGHDLVTSFKRWGYLLRGSIDIPPTPIGSSAVGVVSSEGDVIVLDALSGDSLGRMRIFGGAAAPQAASSQAFFVASEDQSVYALEVRTGRLLWRRRGEEPIVHAPAFDDDYLYVSVPGEGIVRIDTVTGEDTWTAEGVTGEPIGRHAGRLLVWDGAALTTLDAQDGSLVGRTPLPGVAFVRLSSFVDGALYTATPGGVVSKYTPK